MRNFFAVLLMTFPGALLFPAGGDADMDAIMTVNASKPASNVRHARWTFTTTGNTVTMYIFARHSTNPHNTLYFRVGGGALRSLSSAADPGSSVSVNCVSNDTVRIFMRNSFNDFFPAWDTAGDGYCRVKVLGFPGYDKTGYSIPPGLWLGWDDARNNNLPLDYNNFCVVLTGCKAKFFTRNPVNDAVWDTAAQSPHLINMVNRIVDRKIEDKY